MFTKNLFELALSIKDPWFVEKIDFREEEKILHIYINFRKGAKFDYQKTNKENNGSEIIKNLKVHDTVKKKWRHLNFFEHECYLHARVPRVKLPDGKVKLVKTPWEGLSNGFTLLFEALLMQLVSVMPVNKVSKLVKESDDKLWAMLHRYIEEARKLEDFSQVDKIGIDETSRAKRHKYISLFVDLSLRKTIYISEGKSSKTLKNFTKDLKEHKGDPNDINHVSIDMSPAFIKGVRENLPNAQITFDKFHITKLINEAIDEVRRNEVSQFDILKQSRYVFLKNEENLSVKQKVKFKEILLSKENLKTLRAYNLKLNFQQIYYNSESVEEFEVLLKKWYSWAIHSQIEPMRRVAKTIKKHWDGIIAFKASNINNGILEGLNSVIQATKSKARGYKTNKNFIAIAYLLTGHLEFNRINSAYQEI